MKNTRYSRGSALVAAILLSTALVHAYQPEKGWWWAIGAATVGSLVGLLVVLGIDRVGS